MLTRLSVAGDDRPRRVVRMAAVAAPAPRTNPRREIGWLISMRNTVHPGTPPCKRFQPWSVAVRRGLHHCRIVRSAPVFCLAAGIASAQTVSLTINTGTVLHGIDERMYGQLLEH